MGTSTTLIGDRRRQALERSAAIHRHPAQRRSARTTTPPPVEFYLIAVVIAVFVMLGLVMVLSASSISQLHQGNSPWRVMRADLFSLSLLASVTLGLVWAFLQANGSGAAVVFFALYIVATTVLFASVPWSKFAHMFFKPAAAFDKRVSRANGTAENLPLQTRDDPEQQRRHSMELLQNAPMDMGLGIKREAPRHY